MNYERNSNGEEMLEELRQFEDETEVMISQRNEVQRILRLVVETIYVVDHHRDSGLFINRLMTYLSVRSS